MVTLDTGVRYFVRALEQVGCRTYLSCDGHGRAREFMITFKSPSYAIAERIALASAVLFDLILRPGTARCYNLRIRPFLVFYRPHAGKYQRERLVPPRETETKKVTRILRCAAQRWEEILGPLHDQP